MLLSNLKAASTEDLLKTRDQDFRDSESTSSLFPRSTDCKTRLARYKYRGLPRAFSSAMRVNEFCLYLLYLRAQVYRRYGV